MEDFITKPHTYNATDKITEDLFQSMERQQQMHSKTITKALKHGNGKVNRNNLFRNGRVQAGT
jgi:hypothetical protein